MKAVLITIVVSVLVLYIYNYFKSSDDWNI